MGAARTAPGRWGPAGDRVQGENRRLRLTRVVGCRLAVTLATATATVAVASPLAAGAAPPSTSPCDHLPQLPQCVAALGPLVDVSDAAATFQPALVQPIPINDYADDFEDAPPPLGVGVCGDETVHPAADGRVPPPGRVVPQPPPGIPPPPGTHGPYCLLSFLPTDFSPLCPGCHRILIDYAHIPQGTVTSPGAEGHWAARLSSTAPTLTAPVNGHSPNIKNLCADKFFNPSPGSDCVALSRIDEYGFEFEGDSSTYHHFPLEGRYYNGPAYLAGTGTGDNPYHWVTGAYVDLDPQGSTGIRLWYGTGYRGAGDAVPDTDQSYGCLCELPPLGHMALSPSYPVADLHGRGGGRPVGGGTVLGTAAGTGSAGPTLPNTAAATGGAAGLAAAGIPLVARRCRRRR